MKPMEEQRTDLGWHLSRRIDLLDGHPDRPEWNGILITEGHFAGDEKRRLERTALISPEDFASRFDELMRSGHAWINLHAAGVFEGRLLVSLEAASGQRIERAATSVNLSGPENRVRQRSWTLDDLI